ncbi:hypothetical protein A0H81_13144 [Grifola frondosa]|uniref:Uncharacterized protein n=1 Tax=Grifola frondosa TaxID=5627 RepID=A0A1C7LQG3_GRIFR|nr:hypothetical protein A0H81_13144 [Grifola frondosa]
MLKEVEEYSLCRPRCMWNLQPEDENVGRLFSYVYWDGYRFTCRDVTNENTENWTYLFETIGLIKSNKFSGLRPSSST